ncbi:HD domain-containing protein [Radiobacillus kanasensis]|uniref:HD domain-containing protein n=1 Tax=Radiobacillus kanasensis TaxID=2844358 RepID=UPI001E5BEDC7|nr:HD domain-containing protein [Radiobacillus kanasensis]UFU01255.1 HD domain-containing protein [Radiobacillus kanasensis]
MQEKEHIAAIQDYVYNKFIKDGSGHDYYHMKRVAILAKKIAKLEHADEFVTEAAGWLHDVDDRKLTDSPEAAREERDQFLVKMGVDSSTRQAIEAAIQDVSFSKGKVPNTLEGKIVQDADRMDAIGAIGIARTFAYGGSRGRTIHSELPEEKETASIQHFYDKLLLLKEMMHTDAAKQMAKDRHAFMETFLRQFLEEWNALV